MRSILESAVREFVASEHLRNVLAGAWVDLRDERENVLPGIRGRVGAAGLTVAGEEIGADLIEMQPGAAFALHTHPGDHVLYVLGGVGVVHIGGVDYPVRTGDSIFIPAEKPHGVRAPQAAFPLTFLAFGHPHKHLAAPDRMRLTPDAEGT
jgi:quercetin dioxygenase-like cupin family protein